MSQTKVFTKNEGNRLMDTTCEVKHIHLYYDQGDFLVTGHGILSIPVSSFT